MKALKRQVRAWSEPHRSGGTGEVNPDGEAHRHRSARRSSNCAGRNRIREEAEAIGVTMNTDKTRIVSMTHERANVAFLGYEFRWLRSFGRVLVSLRETEAEEGASRPARRPRRPPTLPGNPSAFSVARVNCGGLLHSRERSG